MNLPPVRQEAGNILKAITEQLESEEKTARCDLLLGGGTKRSRCRGSRLNTVPNRVELTMERAERNYEDKTNVDVNAAIPRCLA